MPPITMNSILIGGNRIHRNFLNSKNLEVELVQYTNSGYYEFRHQDAYYPKIITRKSRTKQIDHEHLEIKVKGEFNPGQLSDNFDFKIITIPREISKKVSPKEIVHSWSGKFNFKKENPDKSIPGLRPPQLGALHAIAAHFSVGKNHEAATIVLPTGTGKTETMLSSLIYLRPSKVLVIVPSAQLRKQISKKFITLGMLPTLGITDHGCLLPKVGVITKGIKTSAHAKRIVEESNVIIATPSILKNMDEKTAKSFFEPITDLYIDEAHHAPAKTWENIREYFKTKHILQFTATPFRNDSKEIGGKIIFNYRLGDAQSDNYYKQINFLPIENYGTLQEADRSIALKAIETLEKDLAANPALDHLLMVRAKNTDRADELFKKYNDLGKKFNPVVIHSRIRPISLNELNLSKLHSRNSRIVICADMLGEGFDLPQLKVAAIHDYHKSLAITLQFIGRFTRKSANVGNASVIANIADPDIEKGLEKLYAANASWDDLIRRLSEERIDREVRLQEIINDLKQKGRLPQDIALYNIEPTYTAQLYRVNTDKWFPEKHSTVLPESMEHFSAIGENNKLLIVLGIKETPVKWGKSQEINDLIHSIVIMYWNQDSNALFVYSNNYKGIRVDAMVEAIFEAKATLINGPQIFNVLNNVEMPLAKNLGSSKAGVISFTQYFGPNVTEGLALIEQNQSELSNIACLGYEAGERVLWGAAQKKGKIWSMSGGKIDQWMDWCDKIYKKVVSGTSTDNITVNFLRPKRLNTYHTSIAISADWGEKLQLKDYGKSFVEVWGKSFPIFECEIEVTIVDSGNPIELIITYGENETRYLLTIDENINEGYKYEKKSGEDISIQIGRSDSKPFLEYIITDPIILNYSDGSFSYHNYLVDPSLNISEYPLEIIEDWAWDDIPLGDESMGKERNPKTIQYKTYQKFENDFDIILNDDGPGEAADLVCLREIDEKTINLTFIHCKNAKKAKVTGEIDNLYVLCGQAQKSTRVKHKGMFHLYQDIKRREERWLPDHSRFLKGDMKTLTYLKNKSRTSKIKFDVILVQPGLSIATVSKEMQSLLATTELYLKKKCEASLRVIVNKD